LDSAGRFVPTSSKAFDCDWSETEVSLQEQRLKADPTRVVTWGLAE
jgi:hypothetical protein